MTHDREEPVVGDVPPEPLTIEVSRPSESLCLVTPIGEIDILTASELSRTLATLHGRDPLHVIIDLSRVTFIDSSGINALVTSARAIEADGNTATLASPSDEVRRVFAIIHLDEVVTLVDSVESALASAARDDGADPMSKG